MCIILLKLMMGLHSLLYEIGYRAGSKDGTLNLLTYNNPNGYYFTRTTVVQNQCFF